MLQQRSHSRRVEPAPRILRPCLSATGSIPSETARALAGASVPLDRAIETVHLRCDHDVEATYELASSLLGADGQLINRVLVGEQCAVVELAAFDVTLDLVDAAQSPMPGWTYERRDAQCRVRRDVARSGRRR